MTKVGYRTEEGEEDKAVIRSPSHCYPFSRQLLEGLVSHSVRPAPPSSGRRDNTSPPRGFALNPFSGGFEEEKRGGRKMVPKRKRDSHDTMTVMVMIAPQTDGVYDNEPVTLR